MLNFSYVVDVTAATNSEGNNFLALKGDQI